MRIQTIALELNNKDKFSITWLDCWIAIACLFLGLVSNSAISVCINYTLVSYFYHRYTFKAILGVVSFCIGSLFLGTLVFTQQILILMIFTLLTAFVKVIRCNLYVFFPAIVSFTTFVAGLIFHFDLMYAYTTALITYVTCLISLKYMNISQEVFKLNGVILGCLCSALVLGTQSILPIHLSNFIAYIVFAWLSIILDMQSLVLLLVLFYGFIEPIQIMYGWLVGCIFSNCLKECGKGAQLFCFVLPVAFVSQDITETLIAILVYVIAILLSKSTLKELIEVSYDERYERQQLASKERLLEHQLNQFSQIFLNIAQFFSTTHKSETYFLSGMAKSMELLSTQLKESSLSRQDESLKIYNLLKGYHYSINRVYVSKGELHQKQISCYFDDCSKEDAYEVILPLLQMVVDRNLQIVQYTANPFVKSSVKIEMNGIKPMMIKGHIINGKQEKILSGDTCSMYQIKQNTICTLSDGMGSGEEAQRYSSFVTQLTQRLLSVGIPVEMAVKSMNSILRLNQGETFATLDIMVFDAYHHRVFLSKSGACATYLIRDKKIIKIQGASLPLGIVHEIEADCYRLTCEDLDLYIMVSDGVDEAILEKWIDNVEHNQVLSVLEKQLNTYHVNDDVSVLLAEVKFS